MNLILSKLDYLSMNPVYGFDLAPEVLQQINMTIDDYYQAVMFQAQRIIDTYLQNYLLKRNWDISTLDWKLQEQIKKILFMECEYLHQNQLFFKKTNDITYSTAGQQTFTFNTNLSDGAILEMIPDYIMKEIKNTGILAFASSYQDLGTRLSQAENQFSDGFFVPDVAWSSKADNLVSLNGEIVSISQALNSLNSSSVNSNSPSYQNLLNLAQNFTISTNRITLLKLASSSNFYPNKLANDYAQIQDLQNLWNGTNQLIQNAIQDIQNNSEAITSLSQDKVSSSDLQSYLDGKANTNFNNVNLGERNQIQYLQVNYDGTITFENALGNLSPKPWNPTTNYVAGDATWIQDLNKARIFLAKDVIGNINKNPLVESDYWIEYETVIDLTPYITSTTANATFFKNIGGAISGNVDMQNNQINNVANLLEKSAISDSTISTDTLWSSSQIISQINNTSLILNKTDPQVVNGQVSFNETIQANKSFGVYNQTSGGIFTATENGDINLELNNEGANFTINGNAITTDYSNFAKLDANNNFELTQAFAEANFNNLNSTSATINNANFMNLTVSENVSINSLNAAVLQIQNKAVATEELVNNSIQEVYNNLSQYNITTWEGIWNSTTSYKLAALVSYNNLIWISNENDNLNNQPSESSTAWTLFSGNINVNLDNYYNKAEVDNLIANTTQQLQNSINQLQTTINQIQANKQYFVRAYYIGATIYFHVVDKDNNNVNCSLMYFKWNSQNGYMDSGTSYDTRNNVYNEARNTSLMSINYPARNNYYSSYEYILGVFKATINGIGYYATLQNFWTPYNNRAVISNETVCFNLPLIKDWR